MLTEKLEWNILLIVLDYSSEYSVSSLSLFSFFPSKTLTLIPSKKFLLYFYYFLFIFLISSIFLEITFSLTLGHLIEGKTKNMKVYIVMILMFLINFWYFSENEKRTDYKKILIPLVFPFRVFHLFFLYPSTKPSYFIVLFKFYLSHFAQENFFIFMKDFFRKY